MMTREQTRIGLSSVFLFFAIFGWKLSPILDLSVLACLPVYVYAFRNVKDLASTITSSLAISIPLFLLVIYCAITFLLNEPASVQWLLRNVRASITFGAIYILVRGILISGTNPVHDRLIIAVALIISLHAMIAVASQFLSDFRHIIYSATDAAAYVNQSVLALENRPLGLTYSLALTSFLYFCAVAILVAIPAKTPFLLVSKISLIALNIVACTLTARTGLIFLPLILLAFYQKALGRSKKQIALGLIFFALVCLLSALAIYFGPHSTRTLTIRFVEFWLMMTNPAESYFVQQFTTMWHLPNDWHKLLFGNSLTGREDRHYVASDIGYILTIYGVGVLGQLLMLLPVLIGGYASLRLLRKNQTYARLSLVILFSYLVLNVKELALLTRTVWPVVCVFISISLLEYQAQRKRQDGNETGQQTA